MIPNLDPLAKSSLLGRMGFVKGTDGSIQFIPKTTPTAAATAKPTSTATPGVSSNAINKQTANYGAITIVPTSVGLGILGGGSPSGGNVQITQNPQFTSNVSNQYQSTATDSRSWINNVSDTVNNIVQYIGGSGFIGGNTSDTTQAAIPSTTVSPSQAATQTATPTQTTSQGMTTGNESLIIIIVIGVVLVIVAYAATRKKKVKK